MSAFVANVVSLSAGIIAGVVIIGGKKTELRLEHREYTAYAIVAIVLVITAVTIFRQAETLAILIAMIGTGLAGASITVLLYVEYVKATLPEVTEEVIAAPTAPGTPAKPDPREIDDRIDEILKRNREHRP